MKTSQTPANGQEPPGRYIGRRARGLSHIGANPCRRGRHAHSGGIETEQPVSQQPPHLLQRRRLQPSALVGRRVVRGVGEALQPDRGHPGRRKGDEVAPAHARLGQHRQAQPCRTGGEPGGEALPVPSAVPEARLAATADHVHAHHGQRQGAGATRRHVRRGAHQRLVAVLLFGAEEDDLEAAGEIRRGQQAGQFERDGHPGGIVVGAGATSPALRVHMRPDEDPSRLARMAPQPADIARDTGVAQGNALLQPCLVAQLPQAGAQGWRRRGARRWSRQDGGRSPPPDHAPWPGRAPRQSPGRRPAAGQPWAHRLPRSRLVPRPGSRCAPG